MKSGLDENIQQHLFHFSHFHVTTTDSGDSTQSGNFWALQVPHPVTIPMQDRDVFTDSFKSVNQAKTADAKRAGQVCMDG